VPGIAQEFPEIAQFITRGTINVRFEPQVIVAGWDHRTLPIGWDGGVPEVFDLVRVRLTVPDLGMREKALMYVAHRSEWRKNPHIHEFLAMSWIPGLRQDMVVLVECDRQYVELPYTLCESGGTGKPKLTRTVVIQ